MRLALKQAEKAAAIGEVPIGCVIVCDGVIVGRGYNKRNKNKTTLAHAEMIAIDKASKKLGDWRLEDYRGCWHVFSRCFLVRYRHYLPC